MQDWNYQNTNDFEVTVELSCEKLVDEKRLNEFWNDNKFSLLSFMGQVRIINIYRIKTDISNFKHFKL